MNRRAPAGLQSEADAYAFLEQLRWGDDGPTECPHCSSDLGAWFLNPKNPSGRKAKGGSSTRSPRRVWKCRENSCRRQFSVLTNTVLHSTKMPVRAWVGAIYDLCSDPEGVSARDIANRWGVTEKSAWAMLMRIQDALWRPEAAGASLSSNAPPWFEIQAPDDDAQVRATEARQAAEAAAAQEQQEAARITAERVQADVRRALAESARKADTGSDVVVHEKVPFTPAGQVQSDVERALAEAFAVPADNPQESVGRAVDNAGSSPEHDSLGIGWLDASADEAESTATPVGDDLDLGPAWATPGDTGDEGLLTGIES